jgi:lupus La protein
MADTAVVDTVQENTPAVEEKVAPEEKQVASEKEAGDASAEQTKTTEEEPKETSETVKEDDKSEEAKGMLKTTRRVDYKNPKNNVKFDPSKLGETDDPAQIRAQVIVSD